MSTPNTSGASLAAAAAAQPDAHLPSLFELGLLVRGLDKSHDEIDQRVIRSETPEIRKPQLRRRMNEIDRERFALRDLIVSMRSTDLKDAAVQLIGALEVAESLRSALDDDDDAMWRLSSLEHTLRSVLGAVLPACAVEPEAIGAGFWLRPLAGEGTGAGVRV